MAATLPELVVLSPCWSCGKLIDKVDRYCRGCGNGQGGHVPWYYRHWGIILATGLGLGPFGIWLAWRSPLISKTAKWIYTALILVAAWYACLSLYHAVQMISSTVTATLQNGAIQ